MSCFKNILVGVDLGGGQVMDPSELDPVVRATVRQGVWLAWLNRARLQFFAALDTTPETLRHLDEEDRKQVAWTVEARANRMLQDLVHEAQPEGVEARALLAAGEPWLEITRQVLREGHDLVVVGTHELSELGRRFLGNTALKLMRRCPCPVWVARAGHSARPQRTLIAAALHPAGSTALRLGLALGAAAAQPIHVLHVLEYPVDRLRSAGLADSKTVEYHRRVRQDAEQALREQLRQAGHVEPGAAVEVHVVEGDGLPDLAIQHFIRDHAIDLLVTGTIGRHGLPGVLIGNTAERLLPEVPCSVLAVKPPGFRSPVTLT